MVRALRLLFFEKNLMIFVWTFHWKCVYLHCFLRGSRKDYSAAPFRHVRCTSTTQALHPNDEYSAPLLDDSVPCVSKPPRHPPVLPEGRRTWSVKREAWSDAIQMDSLLTPHYSLLILSKAIGLCACCVRRLMPKSESEPSNKNKNFISPARTTESASRPLPSCRECKVGVFLVM